MIEELDCVYLEIVLLNTKLTVTQKYYIYPGHQSSQHNLVQSFLAKYLTLLSW